MIADELRGGDLGVPDDEAAELGVAIAAKFKKEQRATEADDADEALDQSPDDAPTPTMEAVKTGQLVFIPPPFARRVAELAAQLRRDSPAAYGRFIGRKSSPKAQKAETKALDAEIDQFLKEAYEASKRLTVDIGLFGRMTTSDLVVDVEAACQVAHAISTHETIIESDYFTALDDLTHAYATTQTERAGAAFLGSGDTETFFNSAVYYKYLNLDVDALRNHLPSSTSDVATRAAGVLVSAAALTNPTGKQNSFASHSVPELILVEITEAKRPISYANAFLQPVEGRNLMTESAKAFNWYVDSVAAAYAPTDVERFLLAIGPASIQLESSHRSVATLDELGELVMEAIHSRKVAK
jgi:CRISPR-associated protein Cas7/Cse4/CasC subtype I-E